MKKILIAAVLISGGTLASGKLSAFEVKTGEELTDAKIKKLGLTADDVKALQEQGSITEVDVREAEAAGIVDDAALKDAIARAEKAEGEVKTLTDKVAALEKDLAEAPQPKAAAA